MKILFSSKREFFPERFDGAINTAHTLFTILKNKGHECEMVVGSDKTSESNVTADTLNNYKTYRVSKKFFFEALEERLDKFLPDIVFTQLEGAQDISEVAISKKIPTILYIPDVEFDLFFKKPFPDNPLLSFLSISHFASKKFYECYGITSKVMYPPIKTSWYKTDSHQNKFITFINPVKVKGVEKVLKCAKHLPHRRFQLVETWPIPSEEYKKLIEQIHLLPNVALRKHTEDMKQIYENSSLLLMPSRWEEAFGRVIVEANINGIPVIASNVGGISEALGNGGKLLTRNASIQTWIEAIEELLTNKSLYENFSKKAYTNSNRKEFNQEYIMNGFLDIANKHINTFSYHDVF